MDEQFDQLVDYIKQQLDLAFPEDQIRQVLHQYNWSPEVVDRAFLSIRVPAQLQQQVSPSLADNDHQSLSEPSSPQKYRLLSALGDTFRAIKNNLVTFLLSVVISYAVAVGSLFLISLVINKLDYGSFDLSPVFGLMGFLVLFTIWYVFVYAFVLTITSLAIYDGSKGHKSSLGSIISKGFARITRVARANLLFALVLYYPIVLLTFLSIALFSRLGIVYNSAAGGLRVLQLAEVVWAFIITIRFALVPYVAIFEPEVSVVGTLKRSKYLLSKGGKGFLVKGILLLLLVFIVLAVLNQFISIGLLTNLTLIIMSILVYGLNLLTNLSLIILSVLANGVLVMLYINRKVIRG